MAQLILTLVNFFVVEGDTIGAIIATTAGIMTVWIIAEVITCVATSIILNAIVGNDCQEKTRLGIKIIVTFFMFSVFTLEIAVLAIATNMLAAIIAIIIEVLIAIVFFAYFYTESPS